MINKIVGSFDEAVADMTDGSTVLIAGFGGPAECPSYLIAAVARKGVKDLTIVGNTGGWGQQLLDVLRTRMAVILRMPPDWYDPGLLVERGQVKKGILSFPAAPARILTPFEQGVLGGKVELELLGQGTLCERIRAAKSGIAAFYTPVGVGHGGGEGEGGAGVQRPQAPPGAGSPERLRPHQGLQGRPLRQSDLPRHGSHVQPRHGRRLRG